MLVLGSNLKEFVAAVVPMMELSQTMIHLAASLDDVRQVQFNGRISLHLSVFYTGHISAPGGCVAFEGLGELEGLVMAVVKEEYHNRHH